METKLPKKSNDEEIKFSYENCWKFIIRPPRDEYLLSELDFHPNLFQVGLPFGLYFNIFYF